MFDLRSSILDLRNVSYRYASGATWVLQDINLTIKRGEYVLLAGASGSGKSTLARLPNGLLPQFRGGELRGALWVDGLDAHTTPISELFRHSGLVFQNPQAQLFNRTVAHEIAFGLESLGVAPTEIGQRVAEAAGWLQIEPLLSRAPETLSGGEAQRVVLAAILATRPALLILDEPFASLDPVAAENLRRTLKTLRQEHGCAILVIEHRLEDTIADVDRLVVLENGCLVAEGVPARVLAAATPDSDGATVWGLALPMPAAAFAGQGLSELPLTVEQALSYKLPHLQQPLHNTQRAIRDALLEVQQLSSMRQGKQVLDNVSFDLCRGSVAALVGANGAGKSTLARHLNGLLRPMRGCVMLKGEDTRKVPVSRLARSVGMVFQNPNAQLFRPTVQAEIEAGPRALKRFDPSWLEHVIALFDLQPLLDRSPWTLSEGQKKRVSFAAVVATRPDLIVLDEPTSGQDAHFRLALQQVLEQLQREGHAILLITHDLSFAEEIAPRWLVLATGQLLADATPTAVMGDAALLQRSHLRATARFRLQQAFRHA